MPIKPESRKLYPANWPQIRQGILERAGNRCEGSPAHRECRAVNHQPHPETGSRVVLTIAHLDHDPRHNDPHNLAAMCQRCHNKYDAPERAKNRRRTTVGNYMSFENFQKMVGEWADETFPKATPNTIFVHLVREVVELGRDLGITDAGSLKAFHLGMRKGHYPATVSENAADCLLLLLHLAHKHGFSLYEAAGVKNAVNAGRVWGEPDELGVVEHVRYAE
jgi:5-methylcytosine-specific restriction endonuclease McrA